jgi:S-adenosylmethionine:tRNA ribosyltransferase-isomerase
VSTLPMARPQTRFAVPGSVATSPPERRGSTRDGVRLLVARPQRIEHRTFRDIADELTSGDLLVINTSTTLPAALDGRLDPGIVVPVHVSGELPDGSWAVEVRRVDGSGPDRDRRRNDRIELPDAVTLELLEPYPDRTALPSRLWRANVVPRVDRIDYLMRHGHPIRYGYVDEAFPLADYQTVYAAVPGSAEMPSAGRPLTEGVLVGLLAKGVTVAPIVLHAGVSSPEKDEPPAPEQFVVPEDTARLVNSARAAGRRVVAVGTTVVRALESAGSPDGHVEAAHGWTELVLDPDRPARVVTGLLSGLHAPEATHLLLLEAVAGPRLVQQAYAAAVEQRYLWHEFGDSTLFLP